MLLVVMVEEEEVDTAADAAVIANDDDEDDTLRAVPRRDVEDADTGRTEFRGIECTTTIP